MFFSSLFVSTDPFQPPAARSKASSVTHRRDIKNSDGHFPSLWKGDLLQWLKASSRDTHPDCCPHTCSPGFEINMDSRSAAFFFATSLATAGFTIAITSLVERK